MLVLLSILAISFPPHNQNEVIPHWIKNDAKLWHGGDISDHEFINCIKWAVEKKIIIIGYVILHNGTTHDIPQEFRDISYYWSTGDVSDNDFASTVRYMITNDIIKMNDDFGVKKNLELEKISVFNETERSVVIIPVLTASAYWDGGFYAHYSGECVRCLTVPIHDEMHSFTTSTNGVKVLTSLGYHTITDVDVDKNPNILKKYDKVIVLHNEYVTHREFDAITKHPHVLYLYPNSLYAEVSVDYWNDTVTLIRGHGYPDKTIRNGFDWKFDNSKFEYDRECANWNFTKVDNGMMLNCYPEERLNYDTLLLQEIKNF